MLAEKYLLRRYQEGHKDGREEGREEGLEEGQRSNQELWEDWNRRRMQAEKNNQPFDEPPPTLDRK